MDEQGVLLAIASNNERMITYLNRHGVLMSGLLGGLDGLYNTILLHRMTLAQCGALDAFMDHAHEILAIATQESEAMQTIIESISTANNEILEALDDRQPV